MYLMPHLEIVTVLNCVMYILSQLKKEVPKAKETKRKSVASFLRAEESVPFIPKATGSPRPGRVSPIHHRERKSRSDL